MIQFGLLGRVIVSRDGVAAAPRAPMTRNLLAALLLNANRVVSVTQLVDVLWGDRPPPSAVASLHNRVMALRTFLAAPQPGRRPEETRAVVPRSAPGQIRTVAPGYLIEVRDGDLDLEVFSGLLERGRSAYAAAEWERAAAELTAGVELWRGEPLEDVTSTLLRETQVPRLIQLRLDALEARVDADLRLGRTHQAIADLAGLTAAHPLRERFHAQLMLACYQAGRRADALDAYRRARKALADELGIDPGPELQQLHQRILTADQELGISAQVPSVTRPAQLPADVADFTGRTEQVRQLSGLLLQGCDDGRPGAVAISSVVGRPGTGKTALAVHVAHQIATSFPDGQLYVSLQGSTHPVDTSEVLGRFLRDLGVPDAAIPADAAERAGRYRTLVAGHRFLIVLDDAQDAAQVEPLLPGSATCAVMVTSRRPLVGLGGAVPLTLGMFGEDEAIAMFRAIAGPARVASEPDAAASVLAYCGGLPLAIRITSTRLASRPAWSIAHLAGLLSDEPARPGDLAGAT